MVSSFFKLFLFSLTVFLIPGPVALYSATPLGLSQVGAAQSYTYDAQSQSTRNDIYSGVLPHILSSITPSGYNPFSLGTLSFPTASYVDPANIVTQQAGNVRAYMAGSFTGQQNTIGYTRGSDFTLGAGQPKMLFQNASTNFFTVTPSTPYLPGDFVDLGNMQLGTKLNFFLLSDGNQNTVNPRQYWTDSAYNSAGDVGLQHFIATKLDFGVPGLNYILLAMEDSSGSPSMNFNYLDNFILLQFTAAPEPATYALLALLLGCALIVKRYKQNPHHIAG